MSDAAGRHRADRDEARIRQAAAELSALAEDVFTAEEHAEIRASLKSFALWLHGLHGVERPVEVRLRLTPPHRIKRHGDNSRSSQW